jgi:hypothetical protein
MMDQDLQELLALWLDDHDASEERQAALLARLRSDDAFRRAFVDEIHLLGMIKAVQSPEPRWLRLEDEAGWSAQPSVSDDVLAALVVGEWQRRQKARWWGRWLLAAAAAVLVAIGLSLALRRAPTPEAPRAPPVAAVEIATVIHTDGVAWQSEGENLRQGDVITPRRLRLRSGRVTLAFFSGVSLTLEGPADLELLAADRLFFRQGKLRALVPRGAEGFTVLAAGCEVVDLGTDFGVNLEPGGKSRVMVFEGEAAVSVLGKDGRSIRGALLERQRAVEVDPHACNIQDIPPQPEAFVSLAQFVPPPLELAPGYAACVLAAKPWGYWRFESLREGHVPNEVAGRPALQVLGGVALERSPGGNHWARFRSNNRAQALLMDGAWAPPRRGGYAIEVWAQADLPSPNAFSQTALVSLIAREDRWPEHHLAYLELTARGRRSPHEPCSARFLDRWPPAMTGGVDVFSRRNVVPSGWHHVVGQKSGDTLELYVDGECVGTSPARLNARDPDDVATTPCRLLVGRLKRRSLPRSSEIRAFEGRLDELAVYDRPLTPKEIRRHAQMRAAASSRPAR